ncbi:hypothetical protein KNU02_gp07 [Gordonia phage Pleakley]|uniref:Uncharacterized protein n=1 Tax=Gordonia phage Pleakley TaxID=2283246 RepID=A0A345M6C5_9CAUD|nr:hypothetical protein KNU02_gp07 [Gordonia phage Pleakley]AXH49733.1 hypothetical protein SEA_FURY_7 [Gordonia phage Fury]AXH66046.1 hypothetical protein SEA_PLEAKLEY_7 [Gordonia phage Pleakley]
MSAKVQEETVYEAFCWDCDWFSPNYDEESQAERAAEEHNEEHHS